MPMKNGSTMVLAYQEVIQANLMKVGLMGSCLFFYQSKAFQAEGNTRILYSQIKAETTGIAPSPEFGRDTKAGW